MLLAIVGLICLLVGLLQACEDQTHLTPRGADVMVLVDGSNSMSNDEFQVELVAANVLLGTLGTAENRSWKENNFNAGLIQYSGIDGLRNGTINGSAVTQAPIDSQTKPLISKVAQGLTSNQTAFTEATLSGKLVQTKVPGFGATWYAPSLVDCYKQLSQSKNTYGYKMCVLITDGLPNDGSNLVPQSPIYEQNINTQTDFGVWSYCETNMPSFPAFPQPDQCDLLGLRARERSEHPASFTDQGLPELDDHHGSDPTLSQHA